MFFETVAMLVTIVSLSIVLETCLCRFDRRFRFPRAKPFKPTPLF